MLALLFNLPTPVHAAEPLKPVHVRLAGKEFINRLPAVSDGADTFVALDLLALFGADWHINDRGDAAVVTLKKTGQHSEIALAKPNGKPMIALSDVAKIVDGEVMQPDALGKDGKPVVGKKGDTVYLLARITGANWDRNGLHVVTSFPVPYHVRTIAELHPVRAYIDCVGAVVHDEFKPTALASDENHALKLRTGQNSVDVARVVVELAEGSELKAGDSLGNSENLIFAGVEKSAVRVATSKPEKPANGGKPVLNTPNPTVPGVVVGLSGTKPTLEKGTRQELGNPDAPANVSKTGTVKTRINPNRAGNSVIASRGGKRDVPPVEVRGISFSTDNASQFHIEVAMSGYVLPYIHYAPGTTQMVMDIPNAVLHLPDPEDAEKTCTHRLVSGIHARQEQDSPPMTRIVVDTARVVGYRIDQTSEHIVLDLLLPRNASGALSDKVIVVDAGHGGAATGADGKGGGHVVYEKDITLAIALKLREALESCGAHVIMTRDRDMDVSLNARSQLANDCGADLFVSIHNDSNGSVNSASGTSTYYHMQDASSRALATCVQEAVMAVTGLPSRGVLSDSIMYQSGFAVLRQSKMPAVLCEVAYINNLNDRRKLLDENFQRRVAQAVCDGLRRYVEGTPVAQNPSSVTDEKKPFTDPTPAIPPGSDDGAGDGK